MFLYDHNNKLVPFDKSKYYTNYDLYYAYYKIKFNIEIPKLNKMNDKDIINYLNNTKNLFSL